MTDQTTDLREQLLHALDFPYCQTLGYGSPEELLAAYDAAVLPGRAEYDALVADADRLRRDGAALHTKAADVDTQLAALRKQVAAPVVPRETAAAVLAVVESVLDDTLPPAVRVEALAGITALLPATTAPTGLRETLAALHTTSTMGECEHCGRSAPCPTMLAVDAALLPATVDRAAGWLDAAAECDKAGGAYAERGANDSAGAAFALMETFLRKAGEAEYVATPCSLVPCEDGGEACDVHERLMGHAEGDHELCAPDCGGPWLRRVADETAATETDDTVHACPGRWGGPDCRCFDDGPAAGARQDGEGV